MKIILPAILGGTWAYGSMVVFKGSGFEIVIAFLGAFAIGIICGSAFSEN